MRKFIFNSVLVASSVLLAACGGTVTPTTTSSKPVNITVETVPSPATTGDTELVMTITDTNGQPIEGAKVDASVDHTGHSGMSMSGLATEQGGGKYAINANFSMSGTWKLTVYVRKGEMDYKEDIEFPVQ